MGAPIQRTKIVDSVNNLFSATQIGATADKVKDHLDTDADAFEILGSLGVLDYIKDQPQFPDVASYRRALPIPGLHKRILTLAFRTALRQGRPLNFEINQGMAEGIEVIDSGKEIKVKLTRSD